MSPLAPALSSSPSVRAFSASCSANATRAPRPSTSAGSSAARVSCACALPAPTTISAAAASAPTRPLIAPPPIDSRYMVPPALQRCKHPPAILRAVTDPHMTPDEFRRRGHEVVDWVADYMERVGEFHIASQVKPGEIRAQMPDAAPEAPEPFEALMRDLDEIVLPGITH